MMRTIRRIDNVLTKSGLHVCRGRYRPEATAKREVGESSEMLCLAIMTGTHRDRDFANVRYG